MLPSKSSCSEMGPTEGRDAALDAGKIVNGLVIDCIPGSNNSYYCT